MWHLQGHTGSVSLRLVGPSPTAIAGCEPANDQAGVAAVRPASGAGSE
jgi:hypothetical protein